MARIVTGLLISESVPLQLDRSIFRLNNIKFAYSKGHCYSCQILQYFLIQMENIPLRKEREGFIRKENSSHMCVLYSVSEAILSSLTWDWGEMGRDGNQVGHRYWESMIIASKMVKKKLAWTHNVLKIISRYFKNLSPKKALREK